MISASLDGRLPYMTYPEPWRGQPKQQPPEFLRPAPKSSIPPSSRYNGIASTAPTSIRRPPTAKYTSPSTPTTPVNLAQPSHKDDHPDDLTYNPYRLLQSHHFPFSPPFPNPLYHQPHYPLIRTAYPPTSPLPPLETYQPPPPTTTATFLSPTSATFSPPSPIKAHNAAPAPSRDKPRQLAATPTACHPTSHFKVPSGKEGSLKHRILIRPEDAARHQAPLDLQKGEGGGGLRRRFCSTSVTEVAPPSPKRVSNNNNNSTIFENFTKGSLIQLASGELRRIEDMRTEDFVSSAENSSQLRLAESTVVRIEEHHGAGSATITLSYNQRRTQVNVESTLEHPFFVYGQGWASCNPEKTQQHYKLKVHRLQVGDIVISLTPREQFAVPSTVLSLRGGGTIMTTATETAMTAIQSGSAISDHTSIPKIYHHYQRQESIGVGVQSKNNNCTNNSYNINNNKTSGNSNISVSNQVQPINLHTHAQTIEESLAARKRRWSAPDICDEDEQEPHVARKLKLND